MYVNNILLDKIIFQETLFKNHIKLSPKIDCGDWLFFEFENNLYLLKLVDNISDIKISDYQFIPKIYHLLFFVNSSCRIYSIVDGYIKKINFINFNQIREDFCDELLYMCLEAPVSSLQTIRDKIRVFHIFKQYNPLQVKIMHLKGQVYILYAEDKEPDKNGFYSVDKRLIKEGLNLFHFVLADKSKKWDKDNILRTEVKLTKLNIKNNRYIIDKNEYKKIESN